MICNSVTHLTVIKINIPILLVLLLNSVVTAQSVPQGRIKTGATFLTVNPDVRSGAMGETGIAVSPDLSALVSNPAKLAFIAQRSGTTVSYSPWMPSLSRDIYLAHAGGFYKPNESSALGSSLRFFSYGEFELMDDNFNSLGQYRPVEFSLDLSYAKKFGDSFGMATTGRFIYSGLSSSNLSISGLAESANAFAVDVSLYQSSTITMLGSDGTVSSGLYLSNLGTKLNYDNSYQKEFLPANLRLGVATSLEIDDHNMMSAAIDFNKLLVPIEEMGSLEDYSIVSSYFQSFSDSRGGIGQELKEVSIGFGLEYTYQSAFALRMGYHYEHPNIGYRRYFTFGGGLKYRVLNLDFAYIAASAKENPLAGSMRIGLGFYIK